MKQLIYSLMFAFFVVVLSACGAKKQTQQQNLTKSITVSSNPAGAKVFANGVELSSITPCVVTIPLTYNKSAPATTYPTKNQARKIAEMNQTKFVFIKDGYAQGEEIYQPTIFFEGPTMQKVRFDYPDGIFHNFEKQTYAEDPTIRAGEATNMVTRDNPGGTALERTIIRWNFDSDPRGTRVFWRVISSVPDEVKNTNELYLTTTPYEETRSFNILGLTYENSRDVTIEIKMTKKGYHDQVKRYNVRQAIDQQEISGFFEMVEND